MEFNDNLKDLLKVLHDAADNNGQQTEKQSVVKFKKFAELFVKKGYQMKLIKVFSDFYESNKGDLNNILGDNDLPNDEVIVQKEIISHSSAKSARLPIGEIYMNSTNKAKLKIVYFLYSVLSNSVNENEELLSIIAIVESQLEEETDDKSPFDINSMMERFTELTGGSLGKNFDPKNIQSTVNSFLGEGGLEGLMKGVENSKKDFENGKPLSDVLAGLVGQFQNVMEPSAKAASSSQVPLLEDATGESNE